MPSSFETLHLGQDAPGPLYLQNNKVCKRCKIISLDTAKFKLIQTYDQEESIRNAGMKDSFQAGRKDRKRTDRRSEGVQEL